MVDIIIVFFFQKDDITIRFWFSPSSDVILLNFEKWRNGELSKIGHHFSNKVIYKLMLSKNVNNKICAPKLIFFNEKKIEKVSDDF